MLPPNRAAVAPTTRVDGADEVDVAVIGGGVAGCYVAYRLLAAEESAAAPDSLLSRLRRRRGGKLVIDLFEGSNRVGGRLWSARFAAAPSLALELGGMRFGDDVHIIGDLLAHLGLEGRVQDFSFGRPENIAYLRERRLRQSELAPDACNARSDVLPYRLQPSERGKSVDALATLVARAAIPGFDEQRGAYHDLLAARRWRDASRVFAAYARARREAVVGNRKLNDLSWRELQDLTLSAEAIAVTQDAGGYDTRESCGSAAGWLDVIFLESPRSRTLRLEDGFDVVPRLLAERFLAGGGRIRLDHRLRRLDWSADRDVYELAFDRGENGRPPSRIGARSVVLAMPRDGLERLDRDSFLFCAPAMSRALRSTKSVKAAKLFLAYPRPWWKMLGVASGRSVTDLPLRQLWYWGDETPDGPSVVLAAYTNGPAVDYWSELKRGEPFENAPHMATADGRDAMAPAAAKAMVDRAHAMLLEVHGVSEAPAPIAACFYDWTDGPYGGGWHVWAQGSDRESVMAFMRRPLGERPVFIVSDCWSDQPGSVQGTLSAAECVLQEHFGLPWPPWLRRQGIRLGPPTRP